MRLRQHGNTLPGSVRPLLGPKVSSRVLLQAFKYSHKQEHTTALQDGTYPPGSKPVEHHKESLMG